MKAVVWVDSSKRMATFEDVLAVVQINITLACLLYVQGKANKIFMYCITEKRLTTFDVF